MDGTVGREGGRRAGGRVGGRAVRQEGGKFHPDHKRAPPSKGRYDLRRAAGGGSVGIRAVLRRPLLP